ncbi:MAG: PAS domain S-box protein [Candidatus Scalindua sp.]|nr:PAS domain S-box protein [Candidatus Scalindua sp.]
MNEKKINILLVEDEESHTDLIFRSFESTTMPVSLVNTRNLNDARASIAESVPDLVIVDYILPDGKGTELIPANKEERPYPIVIMSSHGDERIAVEAIKAGAFDYIVKSGAVLDNMPNVCEKILLEWNSTIRHKTVVEQELKESEVRFHGILSSLYESAIIIYDRDGKITALWGTLEMDKRYGIRAVDAIGRSIRDFAHPDQVEQRLSDIRSVFDAGEKMLVEYMISVTNGNFHHEASLCPMRNADGNITAVVGFVRDITERKNAEQRLVAQYFITKILAESATTEEALPNILEAICAALEWDLGEIWVFDQQENVLRNIEIWHMPSLKVPEFIAVTKQTTFPSQIGLPGRVWKSAKPLWVEDITSDTNFPRASVAAKEGLHGAFGFPIISGSEVLGAIVFFSHEVREPDNNLLSMMSAVGSQIGIFISNKRVEKELRESEERFRGIFEQAAVGIIHVASSGRFLKANKRFCAITGYTEQEILGRTFQDITHPDDLNMQRQARKRVLDGEASNYQIEKRYIRKDGAIIWINLTVALIRDSSGEPDYLVSVIEDITEQKFAEDRIRKLSHAVEQSSSTVIMTDTKGNIEYANPKFTQLTGYSLEEAVGKTPRILKSGKTPREAYRELWKTIKSGNEWSGEFCNKKKSGELYWEYASISPVKDEKGDITNFIAVKEDITERKKMEEALLQSEKLNSLGTITAGVAHEFNNILAIVMGLAEVLEGGFKDDQELKRGLKAIIEAGEDGAGIVKRMLTFAKAELSELDYNFISIQYLIEQAIGFTMPRWKNMAQAEDIKYNINTVGITETPEVFCNPTELREVFVNLIHNALDAMPDGGTITVATRRVQSEKRKVSELKSQNSELKSDFIEIIFADIGKGMPEEVKRKIFDPFFTTRRPHGTGLGMSVTYGIMKRHGGKIEVESKEGKGTTFTLHIPIRKEALQRVVTSESVREIETKELRILVVDDDQEMCVILKTFLSGKGHIVKAVNSGAEAIELSRRDDFDLVLCDLAMPEVTGHDIIKALNKLDKRPKVGLMTGWCEEIRHIDTVALKVDFIARKPFNLLELEKNISALVI